MIRRYSGRGCPTYDPRRPRDSVPFFNRYFEWIVVPGGEDKVPKQVADKHDTARGNGDASEEPLAIREGEPDGSVGSLRSPEQEGGAQMNGPVTGHILVADDDG